MKRSRRSEHDLDLERKVLRRAKSIIERTVLTPSGYDSLRGKAAGERFKAGLAAERSGWEESGSKAIKRKGGNWSIVGYRLRFMRRRDDGSLEEMHRQVVVDPDGSIRDQGDEAEQLQLDAAAENVGAEVANTEPAGTDDDIPF